MADGPLTAAAGRRRPTFFLEFTLMFAAVALVLSLAAGLFVTRFLAADIRDRTLEDVEREVSEVTAPGLARRLPTGQIQQPLSGEALSRFDQYVRENVLSSRTIRVNIWNRDGTTVYSSYAPLIGTSITADGLAAAIGGQTMADVERVADSPERAGLESFGSVLEVYVPVAQEGSILPVGALEIYRDYGPIAAHVRDIQRSVFIAIGATLAALYVALVILVRRGSNTLRRQQAELQRHSDELRSSYESIVAVLCTALDMRDNVTHGHAQRVSQLASVVAWHMGLRHEEVRQMEKAAILHDIGKIGVADGVLSKPGALTEAEWVEMKRHPELGYKILQGIRYLNDVADVVYAHHERFDGSGYPKGLKGDQIPLGARIFGVVDAYDAMTSDRPYRKAMPHNHAMSEIARNSGTQFDPEVVKAFLEVERRGLVNGRRDQDQAHEPAASRVAAQV